jgi:ankyrin repeat protein
MTATSSSSSSSSYTLQQQELRIVNCEVIRMLLAHDASQVDVQSEGNGNTPLHLAYKYPEYLTLLLARGSAVNALNDQGASALVSILLR